MIKKLFPFLIKVLNSYSDILRVADTFCQ